MASHERERAASTGIFNSGSNVGIIIAAYAVPLVVEKFDWGWAAAFYLTGALGFLWLIFWLAAYDVPNRHPRVSPAELAVIRSDPPDAPDPIPWISLLGHRQTWAYALGMFLASPVWWFYLYWLPKFLKKQPRDRPGARVLAAADRLPDGRPGQHRRGRAVNLADSPRRERQCRPQDGLPGLRASASPPS